MFPTKSSALVVSVALFASSPVRAADPEPEKFTFCFQREPWEDVIAWYAKVSGLKADVRVKLEGVLTCKPPRDRRFTVGEITDLLNEALPQKGLLLIPHHKSFAVVSTDEKIDPKLIARVEYKDLHKWAKSAVVEIAFPVGHFKPEEIKEELKTLLSPVGKFVSVNGTSIVIRETVENILRLTKRFTTCP